MLNSWSRVEIVKIKNYYNRNKNINASEFVVTRFWFYVTPSLKPINERIVNFLRKTSEQWNNDKISNRMYQNKMI